MACHCPRGHPWYPTRAISGLPTLVRQGSANQSLQAGPGGTRELGIQLAAPNQYGRAHCIPCVGKGVAVGLHVYACGVPGQGGSSQHPRRGGQPVTQPQHGRQPAAPLLPGCDGCGGGPPEEAAAYGLVSALQTYGFPCYGPESGPLGPPW